MTYHFTHIITRKFIFIKYIWPCSREIHLQDNWMGHWSWLNWPFEYAKKFVVHSTILLVKERSIRISERSNLSSVHRVLSIGIDNKIKQISKIRTLQSMKCLFYTSRLLQTKQWDLHCLLGLFELRRIVLISTLRSRFESCMDLCKKK